MFITFEGPEGSGKSSQIKLLIPWLQAQGHHIIATREPGGTHIGNQIRDCLHDVNNTDMASMTELLLYSASRAQLVQEIIKPALADGHIIIADRFADSTLAYQGYGRGLDLQMLHRITRYATDGLQPDLTLFLDIDVQRGLARRVDGNEEMNRLDLEAVSFHERVRSGYHELATMPRWVWIDADQSVDAIQQEIREIISSKLRG